MSKRRVSDDLQHVKLRIIFELQITALYLSGGVKGTRSSGISLFSPCPPKWPALEKTLVEHFTAARAENKIVTVHWFRRMSQQIWQILYPQSINVFFFYQHQGS
jgi:hypothetical protein